MSFIYIYADVYHLILTKDPHGFPMRKLKFWDFPTIRN